MRLSLPRLLFVVLFLASSVLGQNETETEDELEESTATVEYYDEDSNSTEPTTQENTTEIVSAGRTTFSNASQVNRTTLVAGNASTTPMPMTTTPSPIHFPQSVLGQWFCTCDLQVGVCDVDCCCDRDCSKFDLTAFPRCQKTERIDEECNTNDFLCIFKDNLPERNWLDNPKVALTSREFENLLLRSPKWIWPEQQIVTSKTTFEPQTKRYKAGDLIWATKDNITVEPLVLPLLGRNCLGNKSVRYLRELRFTCASRTLISTDLKDLSLLADPSLPLANQSEPWVPLRRFLCTNESAENCVENANETRARRISIHIFHNGTHGISKAKLLVWPLRDDVANDYLLDVSVRFFWKDAAPPTSLRSGSPGYLSGSPILTGVLSNNKTTIIARGQFHLATADKSGACNPQLRTLRFGENVLATCELTLNKSSGCASKDVLGALAGRHRVDAVVASFGDAEDGGLADWLPILVREQAGGEAAAECDRVTISLSIQVLWAKVGAVQAPQSKLVGLMLSFGAKRTLDGDVVRLSTSVAFREVTVGLKGLFAPPPKYEIRLPNDFFYPFFSAAPKPRTFRPELIFAFWVLLYRA